MDLFRNMWFKCQIFWNFKNLHLLSICNLFHVVRGYALYTFNPFMFIETCFMAQNMLYLADVPYSLEKK